MSSRLLASMKIGVWESLLPPIAICPELLNNGHMRGEALLLAILASVGTLMLSSLLDVRTAIETAAGLSGISGLCSATEPFGLLDSQAMRRKGAYPATKARS